MGEVWRARDGKLGLEVAIQVLSEQSMSGPAPFAAVVNWAAAVRK